MNGILKHFSRSQTGEKILFLKIKEGYGSLFVPYKRKKICRYNDIKYVDITTYMLF